MVQKHCLLLVESDESRRKGVDSKWAGAVRSRNVVGLLNNCHDDLLGLGLV